MEISGRDRDPGTDSTLRQEPEGLSAACSTEMSLTFVMALSRHIPLQQIFYATDLDKQVIAKAKTGLYGEKSIEGVPEDLKKKYFTKIGPSYKIAD